MKKSNKIGLRLDANTLRPLVAEQLAGVHGGWMFPTSFTMCGTTAGTDRCCATYTCPRG